MFCWTTAILYLYHYMIIVDIFDRLADPDSLSTQRYVQGKQFSRVDISSFWITRSQRYGRRDKGQ